MRFNPAGSVDALAYPLGRLQRAEKQHNPPRAALVSTSTQSPQTNAKGVHWSKTAGAPGRHCARQAGARGYISEKRLYLALRDLHLFRAVATRKRTLAASRPSGFVTWPYNALRVQVPKSAARLCPDCRL